MNVTQMRHCLNKYTNLIYKIKKIYQIENKDEANIKEQERTSSEGKREASTSNKLSNHTNKILRHQEC